METREALKFRYIKVIQQNHGQGWEDVKEYETNSQGYPKELTLIKNKFSREGYLTLLAYDLKEHRLLGHTIKVVRRKSTVETAKEN